jgi:ABC-type multidrug transport system ATPase subunit/ABC-type multidrug transport system permease subunit
LIYTGSELKQYDESSHIRVEALNLKKVGNNNVILLNDISLVIPPRKFVALVGGSGAGKSTLMDALNGLRPAHQGGVYYNGVDYYHNQDAFRTQLGYVPQDDIVHRDLTVQRALYYVARLRLPSDFSDKQIQRRIDEVLEDVDLLDRRNLLVSKLSGGQRKRVSIALELLGNPGIFFLDEPTSGLDPGLDRKMMSLLRRLADRGRTIILVTHATNNINACDYVCFLTQGGRLAFFGPPNEAKEYFEKTDFAEIYNVLEPTREQPDVPVQAEARFRASPNYQRYIAGPIVESQQTQPQTKVGDKKARKSGQASKRGNPFMQFWLLSRRYLELLRNDRGNLLILLLQAPIIAIMVMLMVHFEIGQDVFKAGNIVACTPQVITKTGPVGLTNVAQGSGLIDCQRILTYLQDNAQGKAYAKQQGGTEQALQNFIAMGEGADAQKVLFIMAFSAVLFGCINGSREIVKEAAIYKRERAVNLRILPYLFSKIFVLGTLCLLQSAVLVGIMELGVPLRQGILFPPILETYITLALTSLGGLMVGLTISVIAPNNDRAISLVPVVLIPQVIFSGAIIPLKGWPIQVLGAIIPTRWAMAALGTSVGIHADKIDGDKLFGDDYTYHGTLFSIYDHVRALHRLLLGWGALGVLIIVFMLVIIFFLKRKDIRV